MKPSGVVYTGTVLLEAPCAITLCGRKELLRVRAVANNIAVKSNNRTRVILFSSQSNSVGFLESSKSDSRQIQKIPFGV
jgi:hypothetical protein